MTTGLIMKIILFCGANDECLTQMQGCVRLMETSRWVMRQSDDVAVRGKIAFAICKRDYEKFTQE